MFTVIFTTILVLAVIYLVLWTLKDNAVIGPIFNAIRPVVEGLGTSIKNGLASIAGLLKKKDPPSQ